MIFCTSMAAIIALLLFFAQALDYSNVKISANGSVVHSSMSKFFLWVVAVTLILVAGLRGHIGMDYGQYMVNYPRYLLSIKDDIIHFNQPGINILAYIASKIYDNYVTMFFLASLVTVGLSVKTILKYSEDCFVSVLLYMFLGCWIGSFNGVKQYLAAAVCFAGHRYIIERKFWKYALVVFIAASFHITACSLLILYFVANKEINKKNIILFMIGTVVAINAYDFAFSFVEFLKGDELSDIPYMTNNVKLFRVFVNVVPAVAALMLYRKKRLDASKNLYVNILIINAAIMVSTSNSTYLARYGIYTNVFLALSIPKTIKFDNKKNQTLFTAVMLILYFAFYVYNHSKAVGNWEWIWDELRRSGVIL